MRASRHCDHELLLKCRRGQHRSDLTCRALLCPSLCCCPNVLDYRRPASPNLQRHLLNVSRWPLICVYSTSGGLIRHVRRLNDSLAGGGGVRLRLAWRARIVPIPSYTSTPLPRRPRPSPRRPGRPDLSSSSRRYERANAIVPRRTLVGFSISSLLSAPGFLDCRLLPPRTCSCSGRRLGNRGG